MGEFEKIKTPSITESAANILLGKILSGELKAGVWLPAERDMAEQMGISRATLHQAVLQLETQGFLSIQPRKGTVVCDYRRHPSPQILGAIMNYGSIEIDHPLFRDLMATRIWLETECTRLACENAYESTLDEMEKLLEEAEKPGADITELLYRFHYKLTQTSGNSIYTMIFCSFETVLKTLTERHFKVRGTDLHAAVERRHKLVDAIRARDRDAAVKEINDILTFGINVLEEKYV